MRNIIRKINDELAISGQITLDQLAEIATEGYRTVVNLRLPDETGFVESEQSKTECLGLYYIHIPLKSAEINHQVALHLFEQIAAIPKPALIHCDNAIRSAAIVLMYIAAKQGIAFEKSFQQVNSLGLL